MNQKTDSFVTPPTGTVGPRTYQDPVLTPGTELSKYEILQFLAEGGMGMVYLGKHKVLQSRHAIKVIRSAFAAQPEFVSRFRREARIMAALEHLNIVRVTDFGEELGLYYYVMDYVSGPEGPPLTLEDEIRAVAKTGKTGGVPERRVREVALQICEALAYAHTYGKEGVAHLDLKPSNILIVGQSTGRGVKTVVKVTDFGFARILDRDSMLSSVVQTKVGTEEASKALITGTPRYMSPEQWKGETQAGPASDIYSFGTIMYEALTGKVPQEVYPAKPPSAFGCAQAWDRIIEKCLRSEPKKRYASAEKLAADIRRIDFFRPQAQKKNSFRKVAVRVGVVAGLALVLSALVRFGVIPPAVVAKCERVIADTYQKARQRMAVLLKPPGYLNIRSDPGVNIVIVPAEGEQILPGRTDINGHRTGIRLPEGTYEVILAHPNYYPVTNRIVIIPGEVIALERAFPRSLAGIKTTLPGAKMMLPMAEDPTVPARVRITCNVPEAEIYKGGERLGRGGDIIQLPAYESHEIEVRAPGYRSSRISLSLPTPGQRAPDSHIELVELGPIVRIRATPPPGQPKIVNAEVLIDGKSIGTRTLPLVWEGLSLGRHTVAIAPGPWKPTATQEVEIVRERPADVAFTLALQESFFHFDVTPADASVYVDGRKQTAPLVQVTPEVHHEIRIWAKDYEPFTDRINVGIGLTNRIAVSLEKKRTR